MKQFHRQLVAQFAWITLFILHFIKLGKTMTIGSNPQTCFANLQMMFLDKSVITEEAETNLQ